LDPRFRSLSIFPISVQDEVDSTTRIEVAVEQTEAVVAAAVEEDQVEAVQDEGVEEEVNEKIMNGKIHVRNLERYDHQKSRDTS
jgi:coenzyme F420-reducing hydrogenase beta subunit